MTTDITELAQLRAELSNPAVGSKDHLRKLALLLVEALEKAQRANSAQDDHINQQQDRIDQLEKRNADLGKHVGMLEKRLKGTEESLIASTDMVTELESRTVKLPTTRLWAGVTECYEKSDVIAAICAAGVEVSDD